MSFYPIDSKQHNSFYYYVNKYYLKGFGIDRSRALLIDPLEIGLAPGTDLTEVFPDLTVDLTLRVRRARSLVEKRQQEVLRAVDDFCTEYERRIRELGGIGFFLGGIGPDGHIAFNVRGSDLFSTTRLLDPNYETKAAAASDLGGMEVARHKSVITIGPRHDRLQPRGRRDRVRGRRGQGEHRRTYDPQLADQPFPGLGARHVAERALLSNRRAPPVGFHQSAVRSWLLNRARSKFLTRPGAPNRDGPLAGDRKADQPT